MLDEKNFNLSNNKTKFIIPLYFTNNTFFIEDIIEEVKTLNNKNYFGGITCIAKSNEELNDMNLYNNQFVKISEISDFIKNNIDTNKDFIKMFFSNKFNISKK